ncbi:MAG: hypothetical protein IJ418_16235 [Clostridia bacterium]|nr:hypothetical protein [Clostridia bacterium]
MKQYQINRAFGALSRLANLQLPVRDSRNVYMLSKCLEDAYNFELEQEKKLIEKYHGVLGNDGGVVFQNGDDAVGFNSELSELNSLDVEVKFEPVVINCDVMEGQRITPFDIACLDGFVTFE